MPLSELTELVGKIDGTDLGSPTGRTVIARRIDALRAMLERVGATNAAAQLGVAALLLQRIGDGLTSAGEEARRMVRTLVVAVEQAFRVAPSTPARVETAPVRETPPRESEEDRLPSASRVSELAVVRDMLLGEILVHFDVLKSEEIAAALELQHGTGQYLGDILVEYGFTTRDEVQRALDYQETIRGMIGDEPRAHSPAHPAAAEPPAPLPAAGRSLGRLRLATEMLLGEVLVLNGTVTRAGLERALTLQRSSGMLIGEALIQTGAATRADIQRALVSQGRGSRLATSPRPHRAE